MPTYANKNKTQRHDVSHYDDQISVPIDDVTNPGLWSDSPYGSLGGALFDELDELSDVGNLANGAVVTINRFNSAALFRVKMSALDRTAQTPDTGWQIRFTGSADNQPDGFTDKTGTLIKADVYQFNTFKFTSGWMKQKPLLETWTYALTVAQAQSLTDLSVIEVEIIPSGYIDHRTDAGFLKHVEITHTTGSLLKKTIEITHTTNTRLN